MHSKFSCYPAFFWNRSGSQEELGQGLRVMLMTSVFQGVEDSSQPELLSINSLHRPWRQTGNFRVQVI